MPIGGLCRVISGRGYVLVQSPELPQQESDQMAQILFDWNAKRELWEGCVRDVNCCNGTWDPEFHYVAVRDFRIFNPRTRKTITPDCAIYKKVR
jgi:hypothetical protein